MINNTNKMKKQTAVEWLFAHLLPFLEFSDTKEREHFRKCLAEAKAMEKEQIMEGYIMALLDGDAKIRRDAEDYYNETYGGDK
jgi:hypothetical protein